MRYGKIVEVIVRQSGIATSPDVILRDKMDVEEGYMGTPHYHVTADHLARLARAINTLGMTVSLDEYGVPTWTRRSPSMFAGEITNVKMFNRVLTPEQIMDEFLKE